MDHGKDPHLFLVALTMMLVTSPSVKIDYLSGVLASLNQQELLNAN